MKLPDECGPTISDHMKQHCRNKRSMITSEAWTPVIVNTQCSSIKWIERSTKCVLPRIQVFWVERVYIYVCMYIYKYIYIYIYIINNHNQCSSIKWIERSTEYVLPRIQVYIYIYIYIYIYNHRSSGFRSNHWSFIATVLFHMVRNCSFVA